MKIISSWKPIQVKEEALRAFLHQDLQMLESDIEQMRICFRWMPSKEQAQGFVRDGHKPHMIAGCYTESSREIHIFLLATLFSPWINETFLHELDHYRKHGYQPGEDKLPYWQRPSEVAARAFSRHYRKQRFVFVAGEKRRIVLLLFCLLSLEIGCLELFFGKKHRKEQANGNVSTVCEKTGA
jgi:hypothetical protein